MWGYSSRADSGFCSTVPDDHASKQNQNSVLFSLLHIFFERRRRRHSKYTKNQFRERAHEISIMMMKIFSKTIKIVDFCSSLLIRICTAAVSFTYTAGSSTLASFLQIIGTMGRPKVILNFKYEQQKSLFVV